MIWDVYKSRQTGAEFSLVVSDAMIEWLRARAEDPVVRGIDSYRDTILELEGLEHWRDELARIERAWAHEIATGLAKTRRLPVEAPARQALLHHWVEQKLASDEHGRLLREMAAAISLALEIRGFIHAVGD